ncbi:hypothetical protein LGK95_10935 [Clostridium algoriphilum]|uniref:hypothetical protein n=1 Tax=Clostridium algoriphilum TaxID=198347 RepID=UPI001CF4E16D|nr:hypothetical protein [Clostridium algoriphilum]MCB2294034.1 hypothetical protein [Clostridium algoriphilum]
MFISPPNNFTESSTWNTDPMFSEPPMAPMPRFGMNDDTRQLPMSPSPTTTTATMPSTSTTNQNYEIATTSPIVNNRLYTQGWLIEQIGKYIKIEFLIGSNMWIDREGILQEVGISYIVIKETGTNDIIMCDIYSIKFVRVFDNQSLKCRE